MSPTRAHVERLVVRIQDEFLATPAPQLTLRQVAQRVNAQDDVCDAVLHTLVDARVLAVTAAGAYARFFPRARKSHSRAA